MLLQVAQTVLDKNSVLSFTFQDVVQLIVFLTGLISVYFMMDKRVSFVEKEISDNGKWKEEIKEQFKEYEEKIDVKFTSITDKIDAIKDLIIKRRNPL